MKNRILISACFMLVFLIFVSSIPHGVRICAKRYKKRVSKVRFESTKT